MPTPGCPGSFDVEICTTKLTAMGDGLILLVRAAMEQAAYLGQVLPRQLSLRNCLTPLKRICDIVRMDDALRYTLSARRHGATEAAQANMTGRAPYGEATTKAAPTAHGTASNRACAVVINQQAASSNKLTLVPLRMDTIGVT